MEISFFDLVQTPGGLGRVQGRVARPGAPDRVIVSHSLNPTGAGLGITELTAYPIDQVRVFAPPKIHKQRRSQ
jgi:hypothetical protein